MSRCKQSYHIHLRLDSLFDNSNRKTNPETKVFDLIVELVCENDYVDENICIIIRLICIVAFR